MENILNLIINLYHPKFFNEINVIINFNALEDKTRHHIFDMPSFEIPLPSNNISAFILQQWKAIKKWNYERSIKCSKISIYKKIIYNNNMFL